MVPKVTKLGHSFKGAALYYLHDKQANTAERVAFTATMNLPTDDPKRAVAHMIDTATHAEELKHAAGIKGGRKWAKPVYAYSLAWHPSERPTQADQIAAARDSLKALGMSDRQALIVAHCDEKHPHVHVIVNRICPETGRAASYSNDRLKLSQWAEEYEKKHGRVWCTEREANNTARRDGQWRKDQSPPRSTWMAWKKAETRDLWTQYRADRDAAKGARQGQYDALWQQKDQRYHARRAEIKALYKPIWRDVFKRQRRELSEYDKSLVIRLRQARRSQGGGLIKAFRAILNDGVLRKDFIRRQEQERKQIARDQGERIRDAGREINKAWKYDRDALQASHTAEDQARLNETKAKTDAIWQNQAPEAAPPMEQEQTRATQEPQRARRSLGDFFKGAFNEEELKEISTESEQERKRAKRDHRRTRDKGGRERGM